MALASLFVGIRMPLLVVILALSLVQLCQSARNYSIKPKHVERISDAAILTRKSMHISMNAKERCMRYSVLLSMSRYRLNEFNIIDNVYSSKSKLKEGYISIDIETLRDELIEAIEDFERRLIADRAWSELIACLRDVYGNKDGKAKIFLRDQVRAKSVLQYASIVSQPYTWLLKRDEPHPELTAGQLTDQIRNFALLQLLDNNIEDFKKMFPDENTDTRPVESSDPASPIVPSLVAPSPVTPESEPRGVSLESTPPSQPESNPLDGGRAESPSSATPIVKATETVLVSAGETAPVNPSGVSPVVETMSKKNEPLEQPQIPASEPNDEDTLDVLIASAHWLYESFSKAASLRDRCEHYAKLFTIPQGTLTIDRIEQLSNEGALIESSGTNDHQSGELMAQKFVRGLFMEVIGAYDQKELGDDTWIELMDCLIEWEEDDEDVNVFINEPYRKKVYLDLLAQTEELYYSHQANQLPETQIEAPPHVDEHNAIDTTEQQEAPKEGGLK